MRILFALPYGPTVTRLRSRMLLEEIARLHEISIVALIWNDEDRDAMAVWRERGYDVYPIPHPYVSRLSGLARFGEKPLQFRVSTSPAFARRVRSLIGEANHSGRPFNAIHIEHLRGAAAADLLSPLGIRTVFDAVDCLAELARLSKQHSSRRVVRTIAALEEDQTRRMETRLIRAADVVTVVAERDRRALMASGFHDNVVVTPNGVAIPALPFTVVDAPVAVFTGKLSYHANQAAVRWLVNDIWPRVRTNMPDARLIVAGADPPGWLTSMSGSDGVTVVANPADMADVIRGARVAVAPVVYSVGIQNKVLEAMAAGVPVVATPAAADGLLEESTRCLAIAADPAQFATETARLLRDRSGCADLGRAGFEYVNRRHTWQAVGRTFETLYAGVSAIEQVA